MQDSHDDIAGKEWLFGSLILEHAGQSEGKKCQMLLFLLFDMSINY